ncbi:MAG: alanine racemase [Fimbriimonas sp.]
MIYLSAVEVDSAALRHNLRSLRALVPEGARIAAVVKGNAYGHGLAEVVRALDADVDAFQVDDLEELRAVRRLSKRPVLVLGYVPLANVTEAIAAGGELAVYDTERLAAISASGRALDVRPRIHLKIDALLGRQGVPPAELDGFIESLKGYEVEVVAAYAHFANIEDTTDLTHAHAQLEVFEEALAKIRKVWPECGRHVSATSGLLTVESGSDLVRIGVGLYGLYPSAPLQRTHRHLDLRPAMRWVTHLAQVKTLPARHPVGYGLTFVTSRETRIGIVPQGYSDGFDRGLSNTGEVLVHGVRCPVLGRVAMNMFAVDLSEVPEARPEDEVVLLGAQGSERITAEDMAARLGTINYEVVTRVSPLLPRIVV